MKTSLCCPDTSKAVYRDLAPRRRIVLAFFLTFIAMIPHLITSQDTVTPWMAREYGFPLLRQLSREYWQREPVERQRRRLASAAGLRSTPSWPAPAFAFGPAPGQIIPTEIPGEAGATTSDAIGRVPAPWLGIVRRVAEVAADGLEASTDEVLDLVRSAIAARLVFLFRSGQSHELAVAGVAGNCPDGSALERLPGKIRDAAENATPDGPPRCLVLNDGPVAGVAEVAIRANSHISHVRCEGVEAPAGMMFRPRCR